MRVSFYRCCCAPIVDRATANASSLEEKQMTTIVIPLTTLLSALLGYLSATASLTQAGVISGQRGAKNAPLSMSTVGAWFAFGVCFLFTAAVLVRKSLPKAWLEALLYAITWGLIFTDWGSAQTDRVAVWPCGPIIMDACLAFDMPRRTTKGCLIMLTLWMAVRTVEDLFRLGLYDFPASQPTVPDAVTKKDGLAIPLASYAFCRLAPFLIDFQITRDFAMNMRSKQEALGAAVAVAEQAGELLAAYDTDAASALIDDADVLPHGLRVALLQLVTNLKQYKPFLPASLLISAREFGDAEEEQYSAVPAPQGRVAVVFTDIVGSTRLWEAAPEEMEVALDLHNQVIRQQVQRNGGYEVKTIGDAFLVTFADPVCAILFGCGVQEALVDAPWEECAEFEEVHDKWEPRRDPATGQVVWHGICVRVGASYGDVAAELNPVTGRTDYRGKAVNLASRCESTAPHGAVCVTAECMDAVAGDARAGAVEFVALPPRSMKGIGSVRTHAAMRPRLRGRAAYIAGFDDAPQLPRESSQQTLPRREPRSPLTLQNSSALWKSTVITGVPAVTPLRCGMTNQSFNSKLNDRDHPKAQSGILSAAGSPGSPSKLAAPGQRWGFPRESAASDRSGEAAGGEKPFRLGGGAMSPTAAVVNRAERSRLSSTVMSQASRRDRVSVDGSATRHGSVAQADAGRDPRRAEAFATRLSARQGTIATVTQLDGAAAQHAARDAEEAGAALNAALARCAAAAARTQGKLWCVVGSAAHATWNVVAPCAEHAGAPPRLAALLGAPPGGPALGAASGTVLHGNVGTARQRFHTVLGPAQRAAEAAAREAVQRGACCLAVHFAPPPAELLPLMHPVDAWGLPGGDSVLVEQPDMEAVQAAGKEMLLPDSSIRSPRSAGGSSYRRLYLRALKHGCAGSLDKLAGMQDEVEQLDLQRIVAELRAHQTAYPDGAAARVPAPFNPPDLLSRHRSSMSSGNLSRLMAAAAPDLFRKRGKDEQPRAKAADVPRSPALTPQLLSS